MQEQTIDKDCCEVCKFFIKEKDNKGKCRRFPPKTDRLNFWDRFFPRVKETINYQIVYKNQKSCGEFLVKGQRK